MTWAEEVEVFIAQAHGDLAVLLGLMALRKIEAGGPGRELGILDSAANTFEKQAHWAANTLRHKETLAQSRVPIINVRDFSGTYTSEFLDFFSSIYAPIGAYNDPTGLNVNHAPNLRLHYARFKLAALSGLRAIA